MMFIICCTKSSVQRHKSVVTCMLATSIFYSVTWKADNRSYNLLGCQDSNLGMPRSKPGALPLGDTPKKSGRYCAVRIVGCQFTIARKLRYFPLADDNTEVNPLFFDNYFYRQGKSIDCCKVKVAYRPTILRE